MQSQFTDACKTFWNSNQQFLRGFHPYPQNRSLPNFRKQNWCISCRSNPNPWSLSERNNGGSREGLKAKRNDNVWSIDNGVAKKNEKESRRGRRKKRGKRVGNLAKRSESDRVLVSGSMLIEVENVLQTQEPVIKPAWNTFASSLSGIWKGVGAVFSPITAEMEPIDVGRNNQHQFDCYTLLHIEAVPSEYGVQQFEIQRRVNWVTLNPFGENKQLHRRGVIAKEESIRGASLSTSETLEGSKTNHLLPSFESFDFKTSDVMEEDVMAMEPGLVFFEDGSYSRGPVAIPVNEDSDANYYISPTLKFEQCLVKGCHKRLRIIHTIEFGDGGSDIQIMRVALYEEQWVSTANLPDDSDLEIDVKPFSQRKRIHPSELTGSWKVFEMSAIPIYGEESITDDSSHEAPYVYLCTETLKKRSLPENAVCFGEEEVLDMADVAVLWLPGGVTGYVDVNEEGILCIGVGWYSDEGINLVMERDYGMDGKLKEVRYKSEVKRRWSDPLPLLEV